MKTIEEHIAIITAHRPCHSAEHDPVNGKLHGYCIVCGIPWPCEIARHYFPDDTGGGV